MNSVQIQIQKSFVTLALLVLPAVVQAQFTFTTNNGAITITYYTGTNGGVIIPSTTNGYPVTSIGSQFSMDTFGVITSVSISSSVTNIGGGAFAFGIPSAPHLTNITVDASNPAYSSLNGVLFDKTQTTLIQFPGGRGGSYTIPGSVTSITDFAFSYNANLTGVTNPNSVTNIGNFANCTSLTNLNIPNSVTYIGTWAFRQCTSLKNMNIPNSVTSIDAEAFEFCESLTNVGIGNSVTNIGFEAFYGCSSLVKVAIPSSVTSIGDIVFEACDSLTNITVSASNPAYSSLNGVLFDKAQATLIRFPGGKGGSYTIPNSVTSIGSLAVDGCYGLTNVIIANSVTSIGEFAFSGTSLTKVIIGNSVANIGDEAFSYCGSLLSVTIPNSVTNIGDQAFTPCPSLLSAYFLGNAPPDNYDAFYGDPATVYYLSGTTGWVSTYGGYGGVPAVLWNPQANTLSFTAGHFGFNLTGPTNTTIVVEACTNLSHAVWLPVATNTFSGSGTSTFSDPKSGSYPSRYYRVRSP